MMAHCCLLFQKNVESTKCKNMALPAFYQQQYPLLEAMSKGFPELLASSSRHIAFPGTFVYKMQVFKVSSQGMGGFALGCIFIAV